LGIELVVRLAVVEDELDRTPEQSACLVDLVDRHRGRLDLLEAIDVQAARGIEDVGHLDRIALREARFRKDAVAARESDSARSRLEKLTPRECHSSCLLFLAPERYKRPTARRSPQLVYHRYTLAAVGQEE
jgi:hypothetical protein